MMKSMCYKWVFFLLGCLFSATGWGQQTWSRVEYKVLDLKEEANGGLYGFSNEYGITKSLLELVMNGDVNAYRFALHNRETLDERDRVTPKELVTNFGIAYVEEEDGTIRVEEQEWPTEGVWLYYIRERIAYVENNGSLKRRVEAICPVLVEDEERGQRYPMCWVKVEDLVPYRERLSMVNANSSLMESDLLSFLNRGLYKGMTYKVMNRRNELLSGNVMSDTVRLKHTEDQMERVRVNVYGSLY